MAKELKCQFCGKVFKTEKGFEKHSCEKKQRYLNFDENAFTLWVTFMKISKTKLSTNYEKKKMAFINNSMYNFFVTLTQWCIDMDVVDIEAFIKYCYSLRLPSQLWISDSNYVNFIHWFIKNENKILAIKRSEQYLELNGLALNELSPNRLFFLLLSGKISNKFLTSRNVDVKSILDEGQLNQLGDLL